MAAKMFSLASCAITFGDEVENIWKKRFSFATVLWFMNRYLSPLGYIVVIVSFNDPGWSKSVCNRYVLYPEILKIFTSAAIGVIFSLRLYSLYGGSLVMLSTVMVLLLAELAVKIWAFTDGTSVALPPGLVGCILTGKNTSDDRFVFTWIAELVFDFVIFIATLSRAFLIYRRHRHGAAIPLIVIMMRDGSRPSAVPYTSSHRPLGRVLLTSTIIGNLGESIVTDWFNDEADDKINTGNSSNVVDNAYELREASKHTASIRPQIIVEITTSLTTVDSMLTDHHAGSAHIVSGTHKDDRSLNLSAPSLSRTRSLSRLREEDRLNPRGDEIGTGAAWQPPQTWMLEDVEVAELGKPRRSNGRPSTS
ncbi:hypothetical protein EW145_g2543 [Phellinidium pouzarii]|uniref:DUF6533 domain-containing protein n=1 Tax=Phellinidium pouzarii TaxID=167371 RepID=A0A4S4LAX3_9AGAM|nr:hypothetical protein EW145_g2543 [Phellinidium pouzarii]